MSWRRHLIPRNDRWACVATSLLRPYAGGQRYTKINGPVLALYVAPQALRPDAPTDSIARAKLDSTSLVYRMPQIRAFERGVPQAHVVLLPHADHFVWRTHEADVLREVRAFIDGLPPR
jgi:non-heme chloroperoxidase